MLNKNTSKPHMQIKFYFTEVFAALNISGKTHKLQMTCPQPYVLAVHTVAVHGFL